MVIATKITIFVLIAFCITTFFRIKKQKKI